MERQPGVRLKCLQVMFEAEFLLGIPRSQPGLEKVPVEQTVPSSGPCWSKSAESAVRQLQAAFQNVVITKLLK